MNLVTQILKLEKFLLQAYHLATKFLLHAHHLKLDRNYNADSAKLSLWIVAGIINFSMFGHSIASDFGINYVVIPYFFRNNYLFYIEKLTRG